SSTSRGWWCRTRRCTCAPSCWFRWPRSRPTPKCPGAGAWPSCWPGWTRAASSRPEARRRLSAQSRGRKMRGLRTPQRMRDSMSNDTAAARGNRRAMTVPGLAEARAEGRRLSMLTAYDAGFARVFDAAGVELVLVGDSLGMVVQGRGSTLPVTVDDIAYHTACVARGLTHALLVADLPFQADATPERALDASTRLLQAGAQMVKL